MSSLPNLMAGLDGEVSAIDWRRAFVEQEARQLFDQSIMVRFASRIAALFLAVSAGWMAVEALRLLDVVPVIGLSRTGELLLLGALLALVAGLGGAILYIWSMRAQNRARRLMIAVASLRADDAESVG